MFAPPMPLGQLRGIARGRGGLRHMWIQRIATNVMTGNEKLSSRACGGHRHKGS